MSFDKFTYHKNRYNKFKSERRCTKCGEQDKRTLSGRIECAECASKAAMFSENRRKFLKGEKKCTKCGRQDERTLSGKVYCKKCADIFRLRYLIKTFENELNKLEEANQC